MRITAVRIVLGAWLSLLSLAPRATPVRSDDLVTTPRVLADMVLLLNPGRPPPTGCFRLEDGELDIALQTVGAQGRGTIQYRLGGVVDAESDAFALLSRVVTRELTVLHLPVAAGSYCYGLTYKTFLPRDADPHHLAVDDQEVRVQMIWIPPTAP